MKNLQKSVCCPQGECYLKYFYFRYLRLSNYVLSWNLLSKHLLIVYKFFVVWREKSILLTKKKPFAFSKCRSHVSKNWASRKTQTYKNVLAKGDNVTFVINGSPKNKVQYVLPPNRRLKLKKLQFYSLGHLTSCSHFKWVL